MTRDEVEARWRELDERELTPEEFDRRVRQALEDQDELQERAALVAWFMRRYPSARERLAYARRKYGQLVQSPLGARSDGDSPRNR